MVSEYIGMIGTNASLRVNRQTLREQYALIIKDLGPVISDNKVIHLDIPLHLNIGDLLIDWGTEFFIRDCNASCISRYSVRDLDRFMSRDTEKSTILLLHGGGNFGDIYPIHQKLRLKVVKAYPNNAIIILPQTVHYTDESILVRDAAVFNNHRHLKVCLRDQKSFDLLAQYISSEKLLLLPDMAVALTDELDSGHSKSGKTLFFRRRDVEKCRVDGTQTGFDWMDLVTKKDERHLRLSRRCLRGKKGWLKNHYGHRLQKQLRDSLIKRAVAHFQQYGVIDSDRLHGIILAQLLQIQTVVRDNSYGKNSDYCDAWFNQEQ